MLTYTQALETVLEHVKVLDAEERPLETCIGQVLEEDIFSEYNLPMTATSMPDGYAVRSRDISAAGPDNPVTLRITGTARAGRVSRVGLETGTAIRVMTGAVVPKGADCVVRFEDTDEPGMKNGPNPANPSEVKIYAAEKPGANIRPPGSNVTRGDLVVPKGTIIGPAQISVLTTIGRFRVKVIRRPVAAVIATGDELLYRRQLLVPGKSYDCNTAALSPLIAHYGAVPRVIGIARDTVPSLTKKIKKGMEADAIITTGGVSKGDYDLVRLVVGDMGKILFSRINMGPGASFAFGMLERENPDGTVSPVPVFGLSGPPGGCLNNFETLVRPAILKMMGYSVLEHPVVMAKMVGAIERKNGQKKMSTVKWTNLEKVDGVYEVTMNPTGKTTMLNEMATTNSMLIVPEETAIHEGDTVPVWPLDWRRDYRVKK